MDRHIGTHLVRATWITWGLLGIIAVPPAMFSVMMFDAPGAAENWATIALAAATLSFPFVCLISVIESRNRLQNDIVNAYCWACLPLVNVIVGGVGLAWISFVQGGKFSG